MIAEKLKELYGYILLIIMLGFLIGVGVFMSDKLGSINYYTINNYNDTVTLAANASQALDRGNITTATVWNGTANILLSDCYELNGTKGTFVYYNDTLNCNVAASDSSFYIIYNYKDFATATRNAMASVTSEVSGIATNWLGLIVTIIVLSLIIFLIARSFFMGGTQGRQ